MVKLFHRENENMLNQIQLKALVSNISEGIGVFCYCQSETLETQ